jgi:hypothetical protein
MNTDGTTGRQAGKRQVEENRACPTKEKHNIRTG